MAALAHLKELGRTVLIVTHQVAALRAADKILALREGTLAGFGDRDQVLKVRRQVAAGGGASEGPPSRPKLVPAE